MLRVLRAPVNRIRQAAASSRGAALSWKTTKITVGSFLALGAGCQSYRISNSRRLVDIKVEGAGGDIVVPLVPVFSGLVGEIQEKVMSKVNEEDKDKDKEKEKENEDDGPIEFAFCEALHAMGSNLLSSQAMLSDEVAVLESRVDDMTSRVHHGRVMSAVVLSVGMEKRRCG